MNDKNQRVELLAPAGNREAFLGALAAGADAVYLGGPAFGARAYADNFSEEELVQTIRDAHICGVRIYMTTNVLTRQDELQDLLALVERMDAAGLDGVIVQDLGVLASLRERCPHLLLHASTQLSVTSAESVTMLKRLGVSRVVPARELSLAEMQQILAEEDIEIEAFIHGAMCYSYSGRCLMSSLLGGRSGNRGRCAGTCRLPYTILDPEGRPASKDGECYPLSMKDLCVLEILPELIDAGIASFKIEGRMKRPEYAAGTTAIYRKYIDRYYAWSAAGRKTPWTVDKADRADLLSLYIRADLSTGYYHRRNGRDMLTIGKGGYRGASDDLLQQIRDRYLSARRQLPVSGYAAMQPGQPAFLNVSITSPLTGEILTAQAQGPVVDTAKARPMTQEDLRRRICKTGETPFAFEDLYIETDGNAFVPVGQLNALRRSALLQLEDTILAEYNSVREGITHEPAPTAAADGNLAAPAVGPSRITGTREDEFAQMARACKENIIPPVGACTLPMAERALWALVGTRAQYGAALAALQAGELQAIVIDGPLTEMLYMPRWERELQLEAVYAAGGHVLTALPYVMRTADRTDLTCLYENCYNKITGFYVRSLEQIEFLRKKDYDSTVVADCSLYHWNQPAREWLLQQADALTLPLELSGRELERTYEDSLAREILPVYGRVPMMISANCVRATSGCCCHKEDGYYGLQDRKRALFPVRTDCRHCQNIIFNSVPVSLHKYAGDALHLHAGARICMFTNENAEQTRRILKGFYLLGIQPSSKEACSMITEALPLGYTNGHYVKSAL